MISLHRALSELKIIDDRIATAIEDSRLVGYKTANTDMVAHTVLPKFKLEAKAAHTRVTDLMARKMALKVAITNANATTFVEILGKSVTIAEVIIMKASIKGVERYRDELKRQLRNTRNSISDINDDVQNNVEALISSALGSSAAVDPKVVENITGPYLKENKVEIVDPIDIESIILGLDVHINDFILNVDATLSEINAITQIEV